MRELTPERFTLQSQPPYLPTTYEGVKYRVDDLKSAHTKQVESESLAMDRMSPDFRTKRAEYEASANADFDAIEAQHPDYSPKFYQDDRDYYQLLKLREPHEYAGGEGE